MTVEELSKIAKHDRFAWIIPEKYERWVEEHIEEVCKYARNSGILVECKGSLQTYHCTYTDKVWEILLNGFNAFDDNNPDLSFGGGVIYTYKNINCFSRLPKKPAEKLKYLMDNNLSILVVDYYGPYLECIAEWDKPPEEQGSCLIYGSGIININSWHPDETTTKFNA